MILNPNDINNHYIIYLYLQEWRQKKAKEKERFTSKELAEKYLNKWSFLERLCAEYKFNDRTARYHAAKEYFKE